MTSKRATRGQPKRLRPDKLRKQISGWQADLDRYINVEMPERRRRLEVNMQGVVDDSRAFIAQAKARLAEIEDGQALSKAKRRVATQMKKLPTIGNPELDESLRQQLLRQELGLEEPVAPQKRKRGRPPGSKNKERQLIADEVADDQSEAADFTLTEARHRVPISWPELEAAAARSKLIPYIRILVEELTAYRDILRELGPGAEKITSDCEAQLTTLRVFLEESVKAVLEGREPAAYPKRSEDALHDLLLEDAPSDSLELFMVGERVRIHMLVFRHLGVQNRP